MTKGDKARKRLKQYLRADPAMESGTVLLDQFTTESDRAVIILAASDLEDLLRFKLQKSMKNLSPDIRARLFDADRPLGTFSSNIDASYAWGVIDKDVHWGLHILRDMRNACAHSTKPLSFKTPEIAELTTLLLGFAQKLDDHINTEYASAPDNPEILRNLFLFACLILRIYVMLGKPAALDDLPSQLIKALSEDVGRA
jgi:hypothetical protein